MTLATASSNFQINSTAANFEFLRAVEKLSNGNYLAFYMSMPSAGGMTLLARPLGTNGTPSGPEFSLALPTFPVNYSTDADNIDIAVLSNDTIVLAITGSYSPPNGPPNAYVLIQTYSTTGNPLGSAVSLGSTALGLYTDIESIVPLGNGGFDVLTSTFNGLAETGALHHFSSSGGLTGTNTVGDDNLGNVSFGIAATGNGVAQGWIHQTLIGNQYDYTGYIAFPNSQNTVQLDIGLATIPSAGPNSFPFAAARFEGSALQSNGDMLIAIKVQSAVSNNITETETYLSQKIQIFRVNSNGSSHLLTEINGPSNATTELNFNDILVRPDNTFIVAYSINGNDTPQAYLRHYTVGGLQSGPTEDLGFPAGFDGGVQLENMADGSIAAYFTAIESGNDPNSGDSYVTYLNQINATPNPFPATTGNDILDLSNGNDIYDALGGNDTIHGLEGNDTIDGNSGSDTLYGDSGDDVLNGGNENDTLDGGTGSDVMNGGAGINTISYASSATGAGLLFYLLSAPLNGGDAAGDTYTNIHTVIGTSVNDRIYMDNNDNYVAGNGGFDTVELYAGNDIYDGGAGFDYVLAGTGNDVIRVGDGGSLIYGEDGDEYVIASAGSNSFYGGAGSDGLYGGSGQDVLFGGIGIDNLDGNGGDDFIFGEEGEDILTGGTGNDQMQGNADNDEIFGDAGVDIILGGSGDDSIFGGDDDDFLFGEDDNDTMTGGNGADQIFGGSGNDMINGELGIDILFGNDGDDTVNGGQGFDTLAGSVNFLIGGSGNDILIGTSSQDQMWGGDGTTSAGLDSFQIAANSGFDIIFDFESGPGLADIIVMTGTAISSFAQMQSEGRITQAGSYTHIQLGAGNDLYLANTAASNLVADDFIFI
ncbi:MAG: calcium-binding protein [Beijerinckiaceae bacterium]